MSNDSYMNTHSIIQTMIMENNNDMKGVESLAAAVEYITKYVSKAEPKDDILVFLHEKLKSIEKYDPSKSVIGKWMSLLIS